MRDATAFGNTPGAAECHTGWSAMAGTADLAAGRLLHALRVDVERLGQVVFSFQTTDHESADEINAAGAPLTFISSHAHINSRRFDGEWNDDDNVSRVPGEREDFDQDGPEALPAGV